MPDARKTSDKLPAHGGRRSVFRPRERGAVDLRSYAAIGDGRTVALVAHDGGVDWWPLPALDDEPVFARLLDAGDGGAIELAPVGTYAVERRYVEGTNVLETTYTTDAGVVRVTDALVTGVAGRLPWSELARRVEGISGKVRLRWRVAPGTRLGTASPWVQDTSQGKVMRIDGVMIAVRGMAHGPRGGSHRSLRGSFTTEPGSRHLLAIAGTRDEPLHVPEPRSSDLGLDRTIEGWQRWSHEFAYDGPWPEAVRRSVLALKLLIAETTGAVAAAATTSLPENLTGDRNGDYRFAWLRDSAYAIRALVRFGLREETHAATSWLLSAIRSNGPALRGSYDLRGGIPAPVQVRDAPGWRGIGPVTLGDHAGAQAQLGVYGDLFDVMRVYVEAGNVLDAATSRQLSALADRACDAWRARDNGLWERPEKQHNTSSKMGCWQALDAAVRLGELGQIYGDVARWQAERDAIKEWIDQECWSEKRGAYVAFPGSEELDASVLLHAVSGFDRGERMSRTIDALRTELGRGPLLYRFTGAETQEGAFTACSFWLVSALACVGRRDEAKQVFDEALDLANDVGLYSEMINPSDGAFLGNLPHALTHLALINAATTYEQLSR